MNEITKRKKELRNYILEKEEQENINIGDIFYDIIMGKIDEVTVNSIMHNQGELRVTWYDVDRKETNAFGQVTSYSFDVGAIGDTIFRTKKEAEKELNERK